MPGRWRGFDDPGFLSGNSTLVGNLKGDPLDSHQNLATMI
jgi:hypothetical protein